MKRGTEWREEGKREIRKKRGKRVKKKGEIESEKKLKRGGD